MSLLDDAIDDLDLFYEDWGEAAVYTDHTGATTTCTILADPEHAQIVATTGGRVNERARHLRARLSEIPNPLHGETFTYNSEVWAIDFLASKGRGEAICACVRGETIEVVAPGYRT